MIAKETNLHTFLSGPQQFIVPIYQRTYSWDLKHCKKLWDDVERLLSGQYVNHFLGSFVYINSDIYQVSSVPQLHIIDGQQRLTTISLLLQALIDVLQNQDVKVKGVSSNKIRNYYLINTLEEEEELRYKLVLNRNDSETYTNLLENRELNDNYSPNVYKNYKFFKDKIEGYEPEYLSEILKTLQKLMIVDISLNPNEDNPQLIFESLNSTGLDLSQSDLIRNYLLMGQDHQSQKELYNNYWFKMEQSFGHEKYQKRFDNFMRDYLTIKLSRIPVFDEIYEEFKQYYKKSGITTEDVINDIYKYSKLYVKIAFNMEKDEDLNNKFNEITTLKVDVAYPFLLQVYDDYQENVIEKNDFIKILDTVISYVFRRAICGIPTNSLNKTFSSLMDEVDKNKYVESVKAALSLKKSYRKFPSDDEFYYKLISIDVYNLRNCKYLLSKLENSHKWKIKEPINVDRYSIEHIMPQNPNLPDSWKKRLGRDYKQVQNQYLHTLGNLTLTVHNSELGDMDFIEKKEAYDKSPLYLNDSLKGYDTWNEETIVERTEELAKKALEVWAYPYLAPETLEFYKQQFENTASSSKDLNLPEVVSEKAKNSEMEPVNVKGLKTRYPTVYPEDLEIGDKLILDYGETADIVDIELKGQKTYAITFELDKTGEIDMINKLETTLVTIL
ncbi:protein of unknown function DUF262 [Methanohalobium evestigatum Z-7303]|uniref:DUF262 domain-containing protein n=1 Tax=Methanohalobium evestigatum (strain ATCC BAA-1072 / DSM 3721 / NBRC 107634 / OCM 161 / Z-7303) TaxID=644295 RepID=D7E7K9_METEZ|nr:DUF262 domain-containing protein [Methanohalobium evestigatum]ADI74082.1 protein of unknown function DUF262 [Methanohalobium evestigatum Z-7303]